jgi:hypothetical protein
MPIYRKPVDGIGPINASNNAIEQAVITEYQQRAASILQAFDDAWNKAQHNNDSTAARKREEYIMGYKKNA